MSDMLDANAILPKCAFVVRLVALECLDSHYNEREQHVELQQNTVSDE